MSWNSYGLDREAQELVLSARQRDSKSLNQGYKMRMAVAYGLERFWGEHLRLQKKEPEKSRYWKETWDTLVKVMKDSGVTIPNNSVDVDRTSEIKAMSEELWKLEPDVQRVALAVLTQLCDCVIWWTQRYKVGSDSGES
jgi:transposase